MQRPWRVYFAGDRWSTDNGECGSVGLAYDVPDDPHYSAVRLLRTDLGTRRYAAAVRTAEAEPEIWHLYVTPLRWGNRFADLLEQRDRTVAAAAAILSPPDVSPPRPRATRPASAVPQRESTPPATDQPDSPPGAGGWSGLDPAGAGRRPDEVDGKRQDITDKRYER